MDEARDDTLAELRALAARLAAEMRAKWDRDLPFEELIGDRWERAKRLGFGAGSSIYATSLVYGDVTVGSGTWVGPFTILDGSGGPLTIGSQCSISSGVQIYTHDSVKRALSGGKAPLDAGPVTIGDNCYIGPNVVIARGVSVGRQSVIGANSLVTRDVEPNSIVAGNPARPIGSVRSSDDGEVELVYREA